MIAVKSINKIALALSGAGLFTAVLLSFSKPLTSKEIVYTTTAQHLPVTTSSTELIARDTRILATTAAERLDAILDPLFNDFHSRVPTFGEWAFGWRTGYRFLREGMLSAITLPFSENPELEQINSVWNELISNKFKELVLQPAGGIQALYHARQRWLTEMRPTVDIVVTDTLRTVALLNGQVLPSKFEETSDFYEENVTSEPQNSLMSDISAASSPIKLRAARPILSRLTIRPPVAAAVTAAGEAIGNQTETLLGSVSNLAAVIVAFLSIDYMLSQTDAGISRPSMENEIHRILDNEHQRLRKTWLAEQQSLIDARLESIRPLITSPPNSAPEYAGSEKDLQRPGQ